MNAKTHTSPAPVVCLEGPSAVGKTTLAAALARECGARVVPELDAASPPPIPQSAAWFVEQSAARWRRARAEAASVPFVVLDGDPFKGLWYNWVYAEEGWQDVNVLAPRYRAHIERHALAFPDLYVLLDADESQLRRRREADTTRRRRNFEKHLRLVEPLRRYFDALREAAPARVLLLDTSAQKNLTGEVLRALHNLPHDEPDSARLLEHIAAWLRAQPPVAPAAKHEPDERTR